MHSLRLPEDFVTCDIITLQVDAFTREAFMDGRLTADYTGLFTMSQIFAVLNPVFNGQ